jgi:hypothetical protein
MARLCYASEVQTGELMRQAGLPESTGVGEARIAALEYGETSPALFEERASTAFVLADEVQLPARTRILDYGRESTFSFSTSGGDREC